MIQLYFLVKTITILLSIGLSWLGFTWYNRTRDKLVRLLSIFSVIIFFRILIQIIIRVLFEGGYEHFSAVFTPLLYLDKGLTIGLSYVWFAMIERLIKNGRVMVRRLKVYFPPVLVVVSLLLRAFATFHVISDGELLVIRKIFMMLSLPVGVYSFILLWLNSGFSIKLGDLEKRIRSSLLFMAVALPIAMFFDEFSASGLVIFLKSEYFPARWLETIVLGFGQVPVIILLSMHITTYHSAVTFVDVERAMQDLHRRSRMTDSQDAILRFFLERGFSDVLQFYGWYYIRQELRPVLAELGYHSLSQLLHDVQERQADTLPL